MENNCKDFFEIGDCMALFAGEYLGGGKVDFSLKSQWHELRRDDFMLLRSRKLQALDAAVALELKNSTRVLAVLEQLDSTVFASGGSLQLLPFDRRRNGLEFSKVFFDRMEYSNSASDRVKLVFGCEKIDDSGKLFTRLEECVYPEALPEMNFPDLKNLLRTLGILLAEKVDAVFDHTLCINQFAPAPRGCYSLELENCRDWNSGSWGSFELTLNARFPAEEKFFIDQKLYNTAQFLHGYILECENASLLCRIKELDFSSGQSLAGKSFFISSMRFTLTLS